MRNWIATAVADVASLPNLGGESTREPSTSYVTFLPPVQSAVYQVFAVP